MGYFNIILLCYFYGNTNAVYGWAQLSGIVAIVDVLTTSIAGFHTCVTLVHSHWLSHPFIITEGEPTMVQYLKAGDLQDYLVTSFFADAGTKVLRGWVIFPGSHSKFVAKLMSLQENPGFLTLHLPFCSLHSTELVSLSISFLFDSNRNIEIE